MSRSRFAASLAVVWAARLLAAPADDLGIVISSPILRQVIQREGYKSYDASPNGFAAGWARVSMRGRTRVSAHHRWEARALPLANAFGSGCDWTILEPKFSGEELEAEFEVPAGGWYRLEVRASAGDRVVAAGSMEPFGVGEIFLVAGQSYAANHNESLQTVEDPEGRIVALDWQLRRWARGDDPQPNGSGGLGTIWPQTMNLLLPILQVPIGIVNTAVSATSSRDWLPGQSVDREGRRWTLFQNLVQAGNSAGRFRAILWQQGESDVIERTSAPLYEERLRQIAAECARRWGFSPVWLLAKSTQHPVVYERPAEEAEIRSAIERLIRTEPFRRGPDTDLLRGDRYRASRNRGGHFSTDGQRLASLLWFAAIWEDLQRGPIPPETPRK